MQENRRKKNTTKEEQKAQTPQPAKININKQQEETAIIKVN